MKGDHIKYLINIILLITGLIILTSCATPNISEKTHIDESDGIIITRIHSNIRGIRIFVHEKSNWGYADATLDDNDFTKVMMLGKMASVEDEPAVFTKIIPLKSGEYYFSRILKGHLWEVNPDPQYFKIKAKHIAYVGDIVINWIETDETGDGYAQVRIYDRENETISEVKQNNPWLFDKYPYEKNIPPIILETVEEYEEVEELKRFKESQKNNND